MLNNTTCLACVFQPNVLGLESIISTTGRDTIWLHLTYICQGFLIAASNILVVAAIVRYEALRTTKEFFLMMALAVADSLYMIGYFFAGIYRLRLVFMDNWNSLMTPWQCMMMPQNLLFSFTPHMASMMLTIISIDRLICVSAPLMYVGLSLKYCKAMVYTVYGYSILSGMLGVVLTWQTRDTEPKVDARCVTSSSLKPNVTGELYAWHYMYIPTVFAFASVVLYIVVWVIYTSKNEETQNQEEARHRKRFVKSLGICCICTFWFYCIPYTLAELFSGIGYSNLSMVCWIVSNLNPFCNIFVYSMRHDEMKSAIKGLFLCKNMPTDVRMWRSNKQATNQANNNKNLKLNNQNVVQHPNDVEEQNL